MKNNLSAALAGFIFAIGLGISGMTRPEKVIGFLDVFGHWDISLMFVMLSSIAIHFVLYRIIRKLCCAIFEYTYQLASSHKIKWAELFLRLSSPLRALGNTQQVPSRFRKEWSQ